MVTPIAITGDVGSSYGYPATINSQQWAEAQGGFGEHYWVESAAALKVSAEGSSARTVRIAAGRASAHGVFVTLLNAVDLELDNPASGTVYYTIVARRTWQTSNVTEITAVEGTSARQVATGLEHTPGVIDDQPLAVVRVTKDQNDVVVTDDLRAPGNKGRYEATSELVLTTAGYMDRPGYVVRIGSDEYTRRMDGTWSKNLTASRWGSGGEYAPEFIGGTGSTRRYWGAAIPVKSYDRIVTVNIAIDTVVQPDSRWELVVRLADSGSPNDVGEGLAVISQPLSNSSSAALRVGASPSMSFSVAGGDAKTVRVWVRKVSGNNIVVENAPGIAGQIITTEVRSGNDW